MSTDTPLNNAPVSAATPMLPTDFFAFLEQALPAAAATNTVADPEALIATIRAAVAANGNVTEEITTQLTSQQQGLAPALRVRLLFWQTLFSQLQDICPLDRQLKIEFERLRPLFLMAGLRDERLAISAAHPLRQLLNNILQASVFWYPEGGRENQQFLTALTAALTALAQTDLVLEQQLVDPAVTAFNDLVERQRSRAQMMEQRYRESELGLAKIRRAQAQVATLLNSLAGSLLPESMSAFLRTTLRTELQYLLINDSDSSPVWKGWCELIKRLPPIFSQSSVADEAAAESDNANRQLLFSQVQVALELLNKTESASVPNQQAYDAGVEQVREHLFSRLRDERHPLAPFAPLMEPDELQALGTTVSPAHVKKVAHLREGDWFLFSVNDEQWLRCKLLLRPPQVEQLLFVNRCGQRVLQKSPRDFSACLATHIATPLLTGDFFSLALAATEKKLRVWHQQTLARTRRENSVTTAPVEPRPADAQRSATDASPAATTAISAREQVPETAPVPASNRQAAAAKAMREAQVLERLAIRRARQATAQVAEEAGQQDAQQSAAALLESVNIGAWFDLMIPAQTEFQRCKLVAIMRSTERFIFTDRMGAKVAEHTQAELIDMLATERARLISNGDDFEGQLTKVVKTLRRDL
jgi:hypothetical protein